MTMQLLHGDCRDILKTLASGSVQTVVTSPPYYGLRDYGTGQWVGGDLDCDHKPSVAPRSARPRNGLTGGLGYMEAKDPIYRENCGKCGAIRVDRQIGMEDTPALYVAALVEVFREVRRVLRDDGTLFLNLGDSYAGGRRGQAYDTAGKAIQDYQGRGSSSRNLYDEHIGALLNRILGSDSDLVLQQVRALSSRIQEHMGVVAAHLPIGDLAALRPTERSLFATLDLARTAIHEAEPLLSSLASKLTEFSQQHPVDSRLSDSFSAYLSSLRSFDSCVRRYAHMSDVRLETHGYSQDTASLYAELDSHIRCTGACYSLVLSWLNPPYIEPQYTTSGRQKQAMPSKNLLGIPWRVAFALQDDGWYLRSDIIWSKPNPMPESVTDRPTRAHEYLFLLSKSPRYFYDAAAIAEPVKQSSLDRINQPTFDEQTGGPKDYGEKSNRSQRKTLENFAKRSKGGGVRALTAKGAHTDNPANREGRDMSQVGVGLTRNKRTVWEIATRPYSEAHFATMPEALIEPCVLAGSSAQACEHCGAPWARVVEKGESSWERRKADGDPVGGYGLLGNAAPLRRSLSDPDDRAAGGFGKPAEQIDKGFAPFCPCPANTGAARSTVLDPFGGSGTVARVAERYQRNAILIDLNQAYIELQEKRTDGVQVELFV